MLAELDGAAGVVVGDALHGQQRGAAGLAESAGLRGRGVLGAHPLGGRGHADTRRPEQLVEAMLLQHLDAQVHQCGGQVVVHQRDRLAVGQPDPLQRVHQGPLGQLQRGGDPVTGVGDLVADDLRGRGLAGRREVVVEAGQLDIAVDALVRDQGPRATLADHEALVGQVQEGGADGGARHAEPLGQLHLVVQPGADLERTGPDGRLVVLGQLEVQRYRAGPVDVDHTGRGRPAFRRHACHPALRRCRGIVPGPGVPGACRYQGSFVWTFY